MKRIIVMVIAGLVMTYALLLGFNAPLPVNLDFGLNLDVTGRTGIGSLAGILALLIFLLAPEKQESKR